MDHLDVAATIAALAGLVIAISGLLGTLAGIIVKLWRRDDVTDRRIDLLWETRLRRGTVEGLNNCYIIRENEEPDVNLALSPDVHAAYQPISLALQALFASRPADSSDAHLVEMIEKTYGMWLAKHICEPLRVSEYACLQMAVMVAKGGKEKEKEKASGCMVAGTAD